MQSTRHIEPKLRRARLLAARKHPFGLYRDARSLPATTMVAQGAGSPEHRRGPPVGGLKGIDRGLERHERIACLTSALSAFGQRMTVGSHQRPQRCARSSPKPGLPEAVWRAF